MSADITKLEPREVFTIFQEITKIPRCSGKEQSLQDWVKAWAEERGINYVKDEVGNILLTKEAGSGFESYPTLTLQVHQDMVCEKVTESKHNFETEPLDLFVKDDYIRARGTSLGADNGIGIAMAMAALADPEISSRGRLEVLMTVEEETSFRGASNVKSGFFQGKKMINLDSEEAGVIIVESSGGCSTEYKIRDRFSKPRGFTGMMLGVDGLLGGHSGVDIHLPRANAIKLMADALSTIGMRSSIRISRLEGGTRGNAIPRTAQCSFAVPNIDASKTRSILKKWINETKTKLNYENSLRIDLVDEPVQESMTVGKSLHLIRLIRSVPQGVIKWSGKIEGLVQTSNNLGVARTIDGVIQLNMLSRSSDNNDITELAGNLKGLGDKYGAEATQSKPSHGWSTPPTSPFVIFTVNKYKEVLGREPKLTGIHGGLECSAFSALVPGIQIVSLGSTLESPHSPQERLQISSVPILWNLIKTMVRDIGEETS